MERMKTNTNVKLKWRHCCNDENPNTYELSIGAYSAVVIGKTYSVSRLVTDDMHTIGFNFEEVFKAKSRSNKDAFKRASNKLLKLVLSCKEDTILLVRPQ